MKTEENPLDNKICNDCNTVGQWGTFVDELICVSTKCCEKRLNENTNVLCMV